MIIKLAAGLPKDIMRELGKRRGLGGSALGDAINRIQSEDLGSHNTSENTYDIPDLRLPNLRTIEDDPRINSIPRDVIKAMPREINTPKRGSQAGDIGRAAGRAARTVRDGAVNTARGVGRSVTDAVRGFGEGWRGR